MWERSVLKKDRLYFYSSAHTEKYGTQQICKQIWIRDLCGSLILNACSIYSFAGLSIFYSNVL